MKQSQQTATTQTRLVTLQDYFFKASRQINIPRKTQSTNVSANSSFQELNLCNISQIDNLLKNRLTQQKERDSQARQKTTANQPKQRSRQLSQPNFKINEIVKDLQTEKNELPQLEMRDGLPKFVSSHQKSDHGRLSTQAQSLLTTLKKTGNIPHRRMKNDHVFNKISTIRHVQFVYDAKHLERVYAKQIEEYEKRKAKEYVNKDVIIEDTKRVMAKKQTLMKISQELNNKCYQADKIIETIKEEYQI